MFLENQLFFPFRTLLAQYHPEAVDPNSDGLEFQNCNGQVPPLGLEIVHRACKDLSTERFSVKAP
jgi:hypothetical protein